MVRALFTEDGNRLGSPFIKKNAMEFFLITFNLDIKTNIKRYSPTLKDINH